MIHSGFDQVHAPMLLHGCKEESISQNIPDLLCTEAETDHPGFLTSLALSRGSLVFGHSFRCLGFDWVHSIRKARLPAG
ncbi:hypothetical protein [Paracraurococcus lichenis]|uniref:Uncharacterized protein n=1 Tax=Paracraurococcus lichenis TaxID=3064888 RepID=A0ABT9E4K1_9PROT|nr:hypothetical protein [Paracraurococcus sp. LOR1-02]MDO9711082.1 hypothetical protein [Paracraurococcus sp. LOR1-02]